MTAAPVVVFRSGVSTSRPGGRFEVYRGECSCGWRGHRFYARAVADREVVEHRREVHELGVPA